MSRRLFSHDPVFGITKYWHYDESSDKATIETVQDEEILLEDAQAARNAQTRLDRFGDGMHKVATVPLHIYGEWLRSGKVHDKAFIRRWLNDPENKKYRTFECKV